MLPCDPTSATIKAMNNRGFITRCDILSGSKELQLFGRLHNDLFNLQLRPSAGRQLADQINESPALFLHDEKGGRFKDHFQIFGRKIAGEAL